MHVSGFVSHINSFHNDSMLNISKRKFLASHIAAPLLMVVSGGLLTGCSAPLGVRLDPIVLSRQQLQQSLKDHLASHWRLANWLELWVMDMQVDLLADVQQVQVSLDVVVQESLLKSRWPVKAKVGFSTRFDPVKQQFVMHQVKLLGLESNELPATILATTRVLVAQGLSSQLEGQALYALRPADQDMLNRYGVQPGLVVIEPQQVRIPLIPRNPT